MSHSIEELKRQMDQAWSERQDADRAFRERQAEYEKALVAAKIKDFEDQGGVIGETRVRPLRWGGRLDVMSGYFVVIGATVSHGAAYYRLAKIKKDGAASKAIVSLQPMNVEICAEGGK